MMCLSSAPFAIWKFTMFLDDANNGGDEIKIIMLYPVRILDVPIGIMN